MDIQQKQDTISKWQNYFAGQEMPIAVFYADTLHGAEYVKKPVENPVEKTVEKTVDKVWRLMKENPSITTKQIAETIGLSVRALEENIRKLKRENRLRRIGGDKGGSWEPIEPEKKQ